MSAVRRFDRAVMDRVSERRNGMRVYDAVFTRCGLFEYADPVTGESCWELRPPEEISKPESVRTLSMVPLTDDHPDALLTSETINSYTKGWVGSAYWDGSHVVGELAIVDQAVIAKVEAGEKYELSCGYTAEIEVLAEPMVWDGPGPTGSYTRIQRNVVYDHVSVVDQGRAGDAKIIKDSAEPRPAVRFDCAYQKDDNMDINAVRAAVEAARKDKKDAEPGDTIKLRGIEFAGVPHDLAVCLQVLGVLDPSGEAPKEEPAEEPAKAPTDELPKDEPEDDPAKAAKDAVDAISKARAEFDSAVAKRVELEKQASKFLDSPLRGLTDLAIMRAAIKAAAPSMSLEGKADSYVEAAWDFVRNNPATDSTRSVAEAIAPRADKTPEVWSPPRLATHK